MQRDIPLDKFDVVVVGSGFFGSTIAERAAVELDVSVAVLERRTHVGGNSYSVTDPVTGIDVHPYGTHIFHTNSIEVWKYVNRFSEFTDYRHRVLTVSNGKVYPMPIGLGTMCAFWNRLFSPKEAEELIRREVEKEGIGEARNLEEKAIKSIGRSLYEAFIKGYTWKQWQTDPRELPAHIISRLPVRFDFNDRYFADKFEGMPAKGYAHIFEAMLSHPNIRTFTKTDFFSLRQQFRENQLVIYTGPIDKYFEYCYGALGWRTVEFEWETYSVGDFQGTSVINYADVDVPYTRIHEFRHLHPERDYDSTKTIITREYSRFAKSGDEPFYPINTAQDKEVYGRYRELAQRENNVIFGGRLGTYRYLDMDQAIAVALKTFEHEVVPFIKKQKVARAR